MRPWYGSRQMTRYLKRQRYCVGRKRIRRLMRLKGTRVYMPRATDEPETGETFRVPLLTAETQRDARQLAVVYLRELHSDGSCIVYLVTIMDRHTRHVLARRLSTTQDTRFCSKAL